LQLTGKVPFKGVWVGGLGVDAKGEKMSKSKGNVLYPEPFLERYGADAIRFWNAAEASTGYDFRCSEEKIAAAAKFLTKLWNVARFVSRFPTLRRAKLTPTDEWILAELNEVVRKCVKGYEELNFYVPANEIRNFLWNLFASHYVEMVKPRAYGRGFTHVEQRAAWFTLHTCMKTLLVLAAPIIPFITDHVWRKIYGRSVHLQRFPKAKPKSKWIKLTPKVVDFNSMVWKKKKEIGLSLRDKIEVKIPRGLKAMEKDLRAAHNLL
jgi:valyl-tRNA synthetase